MDTSKTTPQRKALLLDPDRRDRREKVSRLAERGFKVFPGRMLEQLRTRCRPGNFDLIVVTAGDSPGLAIQICDEIRARNPQQAVVLMANGNCDRDYVIANRLELLLEKVDALFRPDSRADELTTQAA